MVADGNDHDSTPEDLFEDLDRFFTPIKELGPDIVDLTDSSVSAAASADPDEDESSPAGTEPRRPRDVDDFLPTGWASDVGAGPGDRTSEVSPGDWSRLRDVLGEEEDEDDLTFAPDEADVPAGDSSLLSFDDLGVESEEPDQEAEGAASAPAEEPPEGLSSSAFPDPWTPQRDGEDAESPMMESPMSEPSPPAP